MSIKGQAIRSQSSGKRGVPEGVGRRKFLASMVGSAAWFVAREMPLEGTADLHKPEVPEADEARALEGFTQIYDMAYTSIMKNQRMTSEAVLNFILSAVLGHWAGEGFKTIPQLYMQASAGVVGGIFEKTRNHSKTKSGLKNTDDAFKGRFWQDYRDWREDRGRSATGEEVAAWARKYTYKLIAGFMSKDPFLNGQALQEFRRAVQEKFDERFYSRPQFDNKGPG